MLSLQEAMQLDFAGGSLDWLEDMDLAAFGFGFEEFGSVDDGSCSAVSAETCTPPAAAPVDVARDSGGDEEEERRLRRKISNRESARRSRARKRRQEEELEGALEALRGENRALATRLHAASRRALAVGLDTARLHAEAGALRHRLREAQRSAVVMLARDVPAAAEDGGPQRRRAWPYSTVRAAGLLSRPRPAAWCRR